MKKFRYLFCTILLLIQISVPSVSFADVSAIPDSDTGIVSVSGQFEDMAQKRVTVQILNPGITEDDIRNFGEKSFEELFANVFEVVADSQGQFCTKEFQLVKSGRYGARITCDSYPHSPVYIADLCTFVSNEDKTAVANMIADSDVDAMTEFVAQHSDLYAANPAMLEDVDTDIQKALVKAVFDTIDDKTSDGFAEGFSRACAVYFASQNKESAAEMFEIFWDGCNFENGYSPLVFCNDFVSESELEKIILSYCTDNSWKKYDEALTSVADDVFLTAVSNVVNHSNIEKLLTENEEYLEIDLGKYNKLSDKRSVNKGLIKCKAKTIKQFKTEFYDLVDDASNPPKTTGGGGGGGGSVAPSKGGNVAVSLPGNPPPATQDNTTLPTQPPKPQSTFVDMDGYEWAEDAVEYLYAKSIINGVSDTEFGPGKFVTREEFAKMIILAVYGEVESDAAPFDDVASSSWYGKYVAYGHKNNVINGISENTFGVGMNITRQDIASLVYRINPDIFASDADAVIASDAGDISDYAKDAVEALMANGIITGYSDLSFCPHGNATRAEAAVIIYRYLNYNERG